MGIEGFENCIPGEEEKRVALGGPTRGSWCTWTMSRGKRREPGFRNGVWFLREAVSLAKTSYSRVSGRRVASSPRSISSAATVSGDLPVASQIGRAFPRSLMPPTETGLGSGYSIPGGLISSAFFWRDLLHLRRFCCVHPSGPLY